jgi:flagellar basal body-associated protein FliL
MAELHVQTKKEHSSPVWIWIVIGLLIAAAVIYFVTTTNNNNDNTVNQNNTTSCIEAPQQFSTETFIAA